MGRPPAYIFIVRHGNRLDAADKLWHITSPTPYDPPLTYGGWTQARAIGQRIADILRENGPPLETPPSRTASSGLQEKSVETEKTGKEKKRRYKVVIHSSPYLRCLQTSIAVGAGIASDGQPLEASHHAPGALQLRMPNEKAPADGQVKGKKEGKESKEFQPGLDIHKSVMRVDGFLGEWLSPDYFELIAPPPNSATMVTGAKTELLRREDYSSFIHHPTHAHAHSHSTGHLWNASRSNTWSSNQLAGQDEVPKSGSQLISPPGLFGTNRRGSSSAADKPDGGLFGVSAEKDTAQRAVSGASAPGSGRSGYVPPSPHFALSHQAPAPAGYVAHARDFCIHVDYQWDSMRAPYDWGDGGEFGEEWTSMHRRFRKGLQKLVDWYATSHAPYEMVTQTVHFKTHSAQTSTSDCAIDDEPATAGAADDDDEYVDETVVVLVSHGAGCNALIGAITQEPVLMDVGLASLSVAVRKPGMTSAPTLAERESEKGQTSGGPTSGTASGDRDPHGSRPGSIIPLHRYYEMKLFANSDHLRSTPTTPTVSSPGSGTGFGGGSGRGGSMAMVMGAGVTRSRHANSLSGPLGNLAYLDNGGSLPGSDVPVRRSISTASRSYMLTPPGSGSIGRSRNKGAGSGSSSTQQNRSDSPSHARSRSGKPATGGITIGSGVTSFLSSPATSSAATPGTAQSGHRSDYGGDVRPRTGSFGLWSPVIQPRDALSDYGGSGTRSGSTSGGRPDGFGLGLRLGLAPRSTGGGNSTNSFATGGGDDDAIEDDDIEILLSFTPEKTARANQPPEKENTATAMTSPGIAPIELTAPALSILPALPRRLVGLHIATPDSDSDDDAPRAPRSTMAKATMPGRIGRAAEPSPTLSTGSSSNGLWSSPFS